MNYVIYIDLNNNNNENKNYSADVYTHDMKKYQYQTVASSISDAYYRFVNDAFDSGVSIIQCIAVYSGLMNERDVSQAPIKVWRQENKASDRLIEY